MDKQTSAIGWYLCFSQSSRLLATGSLPIWLSTYSALSVSKWLRNGECMSSLWHAVVAINCQTSCQNGSFFARFVRKFARIDTLISCHSVPEIRLVADMSAHVSLLTPACEQSNLWHTLSIFFDQRGWNSSFSRCYCWGYITVASDGGWGTVRFPPTRSHSWGNEDGIEVRHLIRSELSAFYVQ